MLSLDRLEIDYEPFPIGLARDVFPAALYDELIESYPPLEVFANADDIGYKYTLSEKYNSRSYRAWIREHDAWRRFHSWVKDPAFVAHVFGKLEAHGIDLGFRYQESTLFRTLRRIKALAIGGSGLRVARLRPRFEFSMLPAKGGSVVPHTDNSAKVVTLVVSMVRPGEWNPAWGGATESSRPSDPRRIFNRRNEYLDFDEVEPIASYPFEPNQAVVFVKTFNSWHCVRPMTSEDEKAYRRTLTINIEIPD